MRGQMAVVTSQGWKRLKDRNWQSPGFEQTGEHPVVGVSWQDAMAFCEWLSQKERSSGQIKSDQSYGLPTDYDWTVAVGLKEKPGGLPKDKDMKIKNEYPWGRVWPPPPGAGNFSGTEARDADWPTDWATIPGYDDAFPRTAPVGSFQANDLGIYDLSGNVWEWCEDWYDADQKQRTLRGASWCYNAPQTRLSSARGHQDPNHRSANYGFRCALSVGPSAP
jgi:formylglycine-generating enzyme required for sulfatase activity